MLQRDVLALDIAQIVKRLAQHTQIDVLLLGVGGMPEHSDDGNLRRWTLGPRKLRPDRRCIGKTHELAAPHDTPTRAFNFPNLDTPLLRRRQRPTQIKAQTWPRVAS
jgi:hypothetical protein